MLLSAPILTVWVGREYASYAYLVVILVVASLIATSTWPAGSILQGMARHRLLAVSALASGVANLALSIALAPRFGLAGVAIGTLIPTTLECVGFVFPYVMYTLGIRPAKLMRQVVLPALLPAIPMAALLLLLRDAFEPARLLPLLLITALGALTYADCYLGVGASPYERQTYRGIALQAVRIAQSRLMRP